MWADDRNALGNGGVERSLNALSLYNAIPGAFPQRDYQRFMDMWTSILPYLKENLNDVDSSGRPMYDYRRAFLGGVEPSIGNQFHWSSSAPDWTELKSPEHPTAWAEHFVRQYGIDPSELNALDLRLVTYPKFFREKK